MTEIIGAQETNIVTVEKSVPGFSKAENSPLYLPDQKTIEEATIEGEGVSRNLLGVYRLDGKPIIFDVMTVRLKQYYPDEDFAIVTALEGTANFYGRTANKGAGFCDVTGKRVGQFMNTVFGGRFHSVPYEFRYRWPDLTHGIPHWRERLGPQNPDRGAFKVLPEYQNMVEVVRSLHHVAWTAAQKMWRDRFWRPPTNLPQAA